MTRLAALAVLLGGLWPVSGRAAARVACLSVNQGPCRSPEPTNYFPASSGAFPVVVANFGLLMPAPASAEWQFVCDDQFGVPLPGRVWRDPAGRLFASGRAGLLSSEDGCDWKAPQGELAGLLVEDMAFDRQTAGRMWALGEFPRALFRSLDGGQTFSRQHTFPETFTYPRLLSAPSDGRRLYVVAATQGASTALETTADGGETWTSLELTAGVVPPLRNPLSLIAVAPDDPATLYFVLSDPDGDEIWRSRDAGRSVARALELRDGEVLGGFAFGATAETLFVAGTAPILLEGRPPARLYVSRDRAATWAEPIPSPESGPSYRCLAFTDGQLAACGAGESGGDRFLVGVSTDEGRSWSPLVRVADLTGAKACVRAQCIATELWLCETHGRCATTPDAASPDSPAPADEPDAAVDAGTRSEGGGCTCQLAAGREPHLGFPSIALAVGGAGLRARLVRKVSRNASG